MTFLNPFVLFGLIAAAIPLVIHLFNFRQPKKVDFSSLAFLNELRQHTIRRLRIRQWLLLLLRTLAIACLVMAFARPTIPREFASTFGRVGRTSVAFLLDNSRSMLQRDQGGAYYRQASDWLRVSAADLDQAAELFVIPAIPGDVIDTNPTSPALINALLDDISVTGGHPSLVSNLARAGQILDGGRFPTRELVVISDLQRTSFDDSLTVDLPANVTTYLLPIGTVSHDNVAVTRVDVASSIVDIDQPVKLRVEVSNYSEAALSDWGVSLYLEGERVAQTTIDLAAGETGRATLTASPRARGWLTGYVEIEDDEFVDDNRRYFTLHVAEARQILLVRGLGSDTRYLELVLSRDIARGESVFSLELIAESALSSTSLNDFDAIVLHGVNSLSSGQITALTRFVSNGGGVMIFEGAEEGAPGVSALVEAMGGGRFTNYFGTAGSGVPVSAASRFDREHPLFASVFETEATVGSEVEKPVVFRMRTYLPGDGDEQTIIAASGGEPFMQEIRGQQGRVLVLPFLAQPDWSDLPVRGLFVPLLHRSMYYLTSADQASGDGFVIGTLPQYRVAASGAASRIVIRAVGGEEWVPEQRPGIQGVVFTIPRSITTPGVYDIVIDGVISSKIAINSAPLESDLRRITVTEAREFLEQITDSPVTVLQSLSLTDASAMSSRGGDGMEIWNVFLGLALLIMVTEMLVAMK